MSETATTPRTPNFPQRANVLDRRSGTNFTLAQIGQSADLMRYGVRHPALGRSVPGKVFLKEVLDLSAMEISYGLIPAQGSLPFYHKHRQNEEVYLILSGEGQLQVDGVMLDIKEGTAIRVAPDGIRSLRNTSAMPMFYIVIQAKAGTLEQWTGTDGVGVPGDVTWSETGVQGCATD